MIKDTKYIIKRILIGVGIILVLSFIRGYKVKALTSFEMYNGQAAPTFPTYCDNKKTLLYTDTGFINLQPPNFIFNYKSVPSSSFILLCIDTDNTDFVYYTDKFNKYSLSFTNFKRFYYKNQRWNELTNSDFIAGPTNGISYNLNSSTTCPFKDTLGCLIWYNDSYNYFITNGTIMYTDFDIVKEGNKLYFDRATAPIFKSSIESLQPLKVNQESYIVAYVFRPKFTNFNIQNYDYQFRIGKNGNWVNIFDNEERVEVNTNNIVYFRILDSSNNEVIDSQTFTITDIGTLNNDLNYSIDFSSDYETLENTNIISKYFVDINYLPKSSVLKYQYQFVLEGSSLDNNNWNSLDPEVFSYNFETLQNGTLYARILDNEDNVLTTNTFTITEIGKFAINNNNKKNNGFFNKITSSINFGGPISGIINIPINLIKTLSTSIATNKCNNYNLGSLFGTTLVLPCVNIKQHLGDSLYFTIDLIIACVMIYHIIKMFGEFYTNLLFMQKNPIQDLGKRGD